LEQRKTYTAAYSMKAGKGGVADDKEPLHVVELTKEDLGKWITLGIALCGVYAERNGNQVVAAKSKGVESVTCNMCKFELNSRRAAATKQKHREPSILARNKQVSAARRIRKSKDVGQKSLADSTTVQ
jgi:hypothetical protein